MICQCTFFLRVFRLHASDKCFVSTLIYCGKPEAHELESDKCTLEHTKNTTYRLLKFAGPIAPVHDAEVTSAGAWGLLRNVLQEFPALQWAGCEVNRAASASLEAPVEADAFGVAHHGGHWSTPRLLPSSLPTTPSGAANSCMIYSCARHVEFALLLFISAHIQSGLRCTCESE
jgi:hypothetical protein